MFVGLDVISRRWQQDERNSPKGENGNVLNLKQTLRAETMTNSEDTKDTEDTEDTVHSDTVLTRPLYGDEHSTEVSVITWGPDSVCVCVFDLGGGSAGVDFRSRWPTRTTTSHHWSPGLTVWPQSISCLFIREIQRSFKSLSHRWNRIITGCNYYVFFFKWDFFRLLISSVH